jgi:hypothetical protein
VIGRVTLALILLLALTAPALAMRPATATERRQVAAKMGIPADCAAVRISTVNRTWARFNSRNTIRRCQYGDGYVVLHRKHHRWHVVWQGSDLPRCPAQGVPYAVGADLHVCRR